MVSPSATSSAVYFCNNSWANLASNLTRANSSTSACRHRTTMCLESINRRESPAWTSGSLPSQWSSWAASARVRQRTIFPKCSRPRSPCRCNWFPAIKEPRTFVSPSTAARSQGSATRGNPSNQPGVKSWMQGSWFSSCRMSQSRILNFLKFRWPSTTPKPTKRKD